MDSSYWIDYGLTPYKLAIAFKAGCFGKDNTHSFRFHLRRYCLGVGDSMATHTLVQNGMKVNLKLTATMWFEDEYGIN